MPRHMRRMAIIKTEQNRYRLISPSKKYFPIDILFEFKMYLLYLGFSRFHHVDKKCLKINNLFTELLFTHLSKTITKYCLRWRMKT